MYSRSVFFLLAGAFILFFADMDKAKKTRNTTLANRRYVFHDHDEGRSDGPDVDVDVIKGVIIEMIS